MLKAVEPGANKSLDFKAVMSCEEFNAKLYAYIDQELSADDAACFLQHSLACVNCGLILQEAQEVEAEMKLVLEPLEPPEGFAQRVVAALPQTASNQPLPRVVKFPVKRWLGGIGTIAAAAVLVFGINAYTPNVEVPNNVNQPNLNVAFNQQDDDQVGPVTVDQNQDSVSVPTTQDESNQQVGVDNKTTDQGDAKPVVKDNTLASEKTQTKTPAKDKVEKPQALTKPSDKPSQPTDQGTNSGVVELPQAAYGVEAEGTLSMRLLANFKEGDIFSPRISKDGSTCYFSSLGKDKIYLWESQLANPAQPKSIGEAEKAGVDIKNLATTTCPTYDVNTSLFSPDRSLMAMNLRGEETGVWISKVSKNNKDSKEVKDDKPWQLCGEGGGKFLAWAPNSSKLLFTDSDGVLYVGYPIEKRIFVVTENPVQDLYWSNDSKSVALVVQEKGKATNSLYVVEIP